MGRKALMGEFGVVFQNEPVDVSEEFSRQENHFFVGDRVEEFDPESASGKICWESLALKQRVSYHQITAQFEDYRIWEDLPPGEYEDDRTLPFDLSFVTPARCASGWPPGLKDAVGNRRLCWRTSSRSMIPGR
jgi:alpha-D-xyloside xylohydrolase